MLLLGFIFILAEVFFVPGTTVVGIVGVIITAFGIFEVYNYFGPVAGHITLVTSIVLSLALVIGGFKTGAWDKFSSKGSIDGRMNVLEENKIFVGEKGKALSTIKPIGKARINGEAYEVRSLGDYISAGQEIEIIKIDGNRIFVKPV